MTIEDLLRDSFAAHESLADPARAQDIARTASPRTRRWPALVAAAAVVALVAGGAAYVALPTHHVISMSTGVPNISPPAHRPTSRDYQLLAHQEADRLISSVPVPPGSKQTTAAPSKGLAKRTEYLGGSDPELIRSAWWVVPMTPAEFRGYVLSHLPASLHSTGTGGGTSSASGWLAELDLVGPDAPAYSRPTLVLLFQGLDSDRSTAVRADTFVGRRLARSLTSFVTGRVRSIDVARTVSRPQINNTPPSMRRLPTVHISARDAVDTLVSAFNALPASLATPLAASCPSALEVTSELVTFHTSHGDYVVALAPYCFGQVTVSRSGTTLKPSLDPGTFDATLRRLAR